MPTSKKTNRPLRDSGRDHFAEAIDQAMRVAPPITPEQRRRIQSLLAGAE